MSPERSVKDLFGLYKALYGGGGGILPEHPKKFSVLMVKLKSFVVNERILEKPFCQCHWEIWGLGFRSKS